MIPPLGGSSQQNSLDELGHTPHALLMECRYFDELQFSADHNRDIKALGKILKDNPEHASLIEQGRSAITVSDAGELAKLLSSGLAQFGPVYPLLAIKCWHEEICAAYQRKGIGDQIRIATLSDIKLWMQAYEKAHDGQTGLEQVYWISRHLCAKILRLGRLQYEPRIFSQHVRIYRDNRSANLLTLAEGNLCCTELGYPASEEPASFTTDWYEDATIITACQVDTLNARILSKPTTFLKADLLPLADKNTEVVFIHIPAEGKLDKEAVDESLSKAKEQFPSHCLFFCVSWLLDPALLLVAPQESNIVSFMLRFAKFPVPFQEAQIFERVFAKGLTKEECMLVQPTSSLQANIQRELAKGTEFRTIGGFIPCL